MYQRWVMVADPLSLLAADAEEDGNHKTHDLVREEEEHRGERYHDEHHGGGNRRLAPRRPSHLLGFGAHFLQELERVDLRHDSCRCLERRGPKPLRAPRLPSLICNALYRTSPGEFSPLE